MTLPAAPPVLLAHHTTLGVGGPAGDWREATSEEALVAAVRTADAGGTPVLVLGGGSNLLVSDAGFDGRVVAVRTRGVSWREAGDGAVEVTAAAGEPWDDLVASSVSRGLAGLECLSGIPGLTGATPIQNVGAYGREVADTLVRVRALDRRDGEVRSLAPEACAFGYRDSRFKAEPDRWLVLDVTFRLRAGSPEGLRYGELSRAVPAGATLREVRDAVLALRRGKSMVVDPADPWSRSAGSFFTNPVVSAAVRDRVVGLAPPGTEVPSWPAPGGAVKLAAAWLIEQAGFPRGTARGAAGLSPRHALALVNRGGATAADVVALGRAVQAAVRDRFGVWLRPEPVRVGFSEDPFGP